MQKLRRAATTSRGATRFHRKRFDRTAGVGGAHGRQVRSRADGLKQAIVCDADVCTCSEDGVPGKECPMDGLCALDGTQLHMAVDACCGFNWK